MRSLFVMDPLAAIQVDGDSTYMLMRESTDRGWPAHYCTPNGLYAKDGRARVRCRSVRTLHQAPHFDEGPEQDLDLEAFDVVWMRKDPPFHMGYIFTTYLLDMAPEQTLVVNNPHGLKLFNEKLWAMQYPDLHPETLLSSSMDQLEAFARGRAGRTVFKPWDGNGGRGVLVTSGSDRNLRSMIELLSAEGSEYVLAQPYLERVDEGDKRILLFDGRPVGAMLRVPTGADFRGNMHVGATVVACELDARDVEICRILGPELKRWGQVFVGIDVIDGHLTEINITSPTGIQEINALYGLALHVDLMDTVQGCLARHRERPS